MIPYILVPVRAHWELWMLQSGGLTPEQSYEAMNRLVDQQAFMLSANDIFYVSAWLFVLLIGVVWLARPVKGQPAQGAGGAH